VGVICAETRIVERITPADPANLASHESVSQQAGGVWYPDSAFKTAQAIEDFNKGEQLPLFIFANWRGFSGGMRDMFDEILKFGSYIVDNLCHYSQPVFVYIPPFGDLRGGAWAVLDPTINPDMMEMYSAETGRGGVLEPSGTVEIKYRDRELLLVCIHAPPVPVQLFVCLTHGYVVSTDYAPLGSQATSTFAGSQGCLEQGGQRQHQQVPLICHIAPCFYDPLAPNVYDF
jgi:hypothetical protein